MKSKLNRLVKGRTKRWKKGHSSDCNPQTNTFRLRVSGGTINAGLTSKSLTIARARNWGSDSIAGDSIPESLASTVSLTSLTRLCDSLDPTAVPLHRTILALISALTDTLQENGLEESEATYFISLSGTLTSISTEEDLTAALLLATILVKRTPEAVRRAALLQLTPLLLDKLAEFSQSDNTSLLRSVISLLGISLQAATPFEWKQTGYKQVLDSLLQFATHSTPPLRRKVQTVIKLLLTPAADSSAVHPAADRVAKHINERLLETFRSSDQVSTVHLLTLLRGVVYHLPINGVKSCVETALRLLTLSSTPVKCAAFQVCAALFHESPTASTLPRDLAQQIAAALYDFQPALGDAQVLHCWVEAIFEANMFLFTLQLPQQDELITRLTTQLLSCLCVNSPRTRQLTTSCLRGVLERCVAPSAELISAPRASAYLQTLQIGLSYQYHTAWPQVLGLLARHTEVCYSVTRPELLAMLPQLADLRNSNSSPELDKLLGAMVKRLGPRDILAHVPLDITGEEGDGTTFPRSWLLPLFRENVSHAEISHWREVFLPLAEKCRVRSGRAGGDSVGAVYKTLYLQCWQLLPAYCNQPTDAMTTFKTMARQLAELLTSRPELRLIILSAIKRLLVKQPDVVSPFTKNFLPVLFNLYTQTSDLTARDPVRLTLLDVIKTYSTLATVALQQQLFDTAFQKIVTHARPQSAEDDSHLHCLFDLLIVLQPSADPERLKRLMDFTLPLLTSGDKRLQKKGYRVLEEVAASGSAVTLAFLELEWPRLQQLLVTSFAAASSPSRKSRLRVLVVLLPRLPDSALVTLIPEAVLSLQEVNNRAQLAARHLLSLIVTTMREKQPETAFNTVYGAILPGLVAGDAVVRCSLTALSFLVPQFKDMLTPSVISSILATSQQVAAGGNSSAVNKSLLEFLRRLVSALSFPQLEQHLRDIVSAVSSLGDEARRPVRFLVKTLLTKLLKKVGYDMLSPLVADDLQKQLRAVRREVSRAGRSTKDAKGGDSKSHTGDMDDLLRDSDSEEAADDVVSQKSGRLRIMETESPADLTDPHFLRNVVSLQAPSDKRKETKKGSYSEDGRLIVSLDDDEDEADAAVSDDSDNDQATMVSRASSKATSRAPGSEYSSRKASGDVKRAGKQDPYAYLPFDRNSLNWRKRAKYQGQFKNIIGGAKRGAAKGAADRKKTRQQKRRST